MIVDGRKRGNFKPPAGVQVDWGHPVASGMIECFLLNEGGGFPVNIAIPVYKTNSNSGTWVSYTPGTGLNNNFFTSNQWVIANSTLNYAAADFTFRALWLPNNYTGGFTDTFMKGNEFRIFIDTNGDISLVALGGTDGGSLTTGMTTGKVWDFVLTRAGSTCTGYVNGISKGTFSNGNTTIQTVNFQYTGDGGRGSIGDMKIFEHQFWNRALDAAQVQQIYENPYCFLRPQAPTIRYFQPAVAAAATGWAHLLSDRRDRLVYTP